MSTLRVNAIQDVSGSGQPGISGLAKAWVNFNGTGTVAIRASFNVSSITDNGTGNYTVNITTALTDSNGAVVVGGSRSRSSANYSRDTQAYISSTTAVVVFSHDSAAAVEDHTDLCVSVFR